MIETFMSRRNDFQVGRRRRPRETASAMTAPASRPPAPLSITAVPSAPGGVDDAAGRDCTSALHSAAVICVMLRASGRPKTQSSPPGSLQKRSAGQCVSISCFAPSPHRAPALRSTCNVTSGCLVSCSGIAAPFPLVIPANAGAHRPQWAPDFAGGDILASHTGANRYPLAAVDPSLPRSNIPTPQARACNSPWERPSSSQANTCVVGGPSGCTHTSMPVSASTCFLNQLSNAADEPA